ncbi:alpha-galactosidase [Streptomyces sp. NBS 14/10]|uniref:alpha-galactosidase n=1 Tax=Streptomyces sp. NBS 14/10 TaxID=1945643 RepID=UPI000B7DA5CF|nr:alpha-galactosidase [Streptomyces sp. NBS 14/10]KAK1179002.1 alpha-galactosidase [Streptomyces sp. NBS 14/10]
MTDTASDTTSEAASEARAGGARDTFTWGHARLTARFATGPDGVVRLVRLTIPDDSGPGIDAPDSAPLPLVEVLALGHGSEWSGQRGIETALGARLRYRGHQAVQDMRGSQGWHRLTFDLHDPDTGLTAEVRLSSPDGLPVLRGEVRLSNEGSAPLTVQAVTSLTLGGLPSPDALDVHLARNDWLAECRWASEPLRTRIVDLSRDAHQHDSRAALALHSRGGWPSDGHLPMGALTDRTTGDAWVWQIESPTGWRWETGERAHGTYAALHGPTDAEHQWREHLAPGESFTTVPAALALTRGGGLDTALAHLTAYRRATRRPHPDHTTLPVVFNDYMNTLMGDPTTERLLPLIDAAAEAGAEYFCIDSGWYDDDAQGWWDSVGAWQPSARRFPGGGIQAVLDHIRSRGMVPGLWLEPEVVGVRSPVATELPHDAFFQRDGVRLVEHGRHHLDLRHPAARAHLDKTIDRIVGEWGVGYLKLDYNISIAPGTDWHPETGETGRRTAPGAGLLAHARAYQDWLAAALDRHPGLVIENCASGGMRMDWSSVALTQLQSTSDQQDPLRYPPIAASAPTAVPPEQGAVWAYPQPEFTDDEIDFALAGALLGRVHLSGHLDRMSPRQLARVQWAVATYRRLRGDLVTGVPFWPLGLPGWDDAWVALGVRSGETAYVTVWRREGGPAECTLPLGYLAGRWTEAELLHPAAASGAEARWDAGRGELTVALPRTPMALLVRLTPAGPADQAV